MPAFIVLYQLGKKHVHIGKKLEGNIPNTNTPKRRTLPYHTYLPIDSSVQTLLCLL